MSNVKPCTTCGQSLPREIVPDLSAEEFILNYTATDSKIMTKFGRTESIMQPLISSYGKPTGGWVVAFKLKGVSHRVKGSSGINAFNKTVAVLKKNNYSISKLDLWLNLNIQWYANTPEKYKEVSLEALLALTKGNQVESYDPKDRNYTPKDWGSAAWNFMGVYLAQDFYDWQKFLNVLFTVQGMLNRDINPSTGCNECYIEFTKELDMLERSPIYDQEGARKWLVGFHNTVNKKTGKASFKYDQAAKNYFWV